jgi:hypothetical protein
MKHDVALKVAESLVEYLRPACARIEIAGSVRRRKAEVKDIELVCIPDLSVVPARARAEFGKPVPPSYKTELDRLIGEMTAAQAVSIDLKGDRMKKLYLRYAGIHVDLFINLPPSQWGAQMVIRTGPADFSHWLVTQRKFGGALPDGFFVKHQVVWDGSVVDKHRMPEDPNKAVMLFVDEGSHVPMAEEADFLSFCGVGWLEPWERVARWSR